MRQTRGNRYYPSEQEQRAANHRKWHEVRPWFLTCPSCEHEGVVETTLTRLKTSNLKCSACDAYLWKAA